MSLEGRVVIVTGAGRGQGYAEACAFAREGAFVVATDVRDAPEYPQSNGSVTYRKSDVTSESDWNSVAAYCLAQWGRIDVLVNNAAIFRPVSFTETDTENFDQHMNVNVRSVFLGMRAVSAPMIAAKSGSIINIASGAATKGTAGVFAYATSKWAVRGMSRSAARDLAPFNIRVNVVLPGLVETEMVAGFPGKQIAVDKTPLGRIGMPNDIASAVLFLASDASSYVTGAELTVDGGHST